MKHCLLGEKIGMTQIFSEEGLLQPVTVVKVDSSVVLAVLPVSSGQKVATVLLGYKDVADKNLNRPQLGFFKSISVLPKKVIRSFPLDGDSSYTVGQEISLDVLSGVQRVDVRGRSSGKGFAGTIKRHHFRRGPRSHGSKNYRAPGSIGAGTTPGRVLKGKKMGGHMGDIGVTIQNLMVLSIDLDKGLLFLKGSVPGKSKSILEIVVRG